MAVDQAKRATLSQARRGGSKTAPASRLAHSARARNRGDDHNGLCYRRLIGQGKIEPPCHPGGFYLLGAAQRPAGEAHCRLTGWQVHDAEIAPKDAAAEAGSERL